MDYQRGKAEVSMLMVDKDGKVLRAWRCTLKEVHDKASTAVAECREKGLEPYELRVVEEDSDD